MRWWASPAAVGDVTAVGGGAFGARVQALSGSVNPPAPSVTLPVAGGGPFTASLEGVSVPALTTGVMTVETSGSLGPTGVAQSEATVNQPTVSTNPPSASPLFTATAVASTCVSDSSGSTGTTTITAGFVRGTAVPSSPAPNTAVNDPLFGNVTLNEQIVSNSPGATSITVNAVHVHRFPADDIILGQSRCEASGPNVNQPSTTTSTTSTSTTTSTTSTTTSTTSRSTTTTSSTTTTTSSTTTTVPSTTTTAPDPLTCAGRTATIVGTAGNDVITGTSGPDVIVGLAGNDQIAGLDGDDVISGGDGNDLISGGAGNDTLSGGNGADDLVGGPGNDALFGDPGSDRLSRGDGNDALDGGADTDGCAGGPGGNTLVNC